MPDLKCGEGNRLQTDQITDRTFEDLWKEAYIAILYLKRLAFGGPPMWRLEILTREQEELLTPLTETQQAWIKGFIKDEIR